MSRKGGNPAGHFPAYWMSSDGRAIGNWPFGGLGGALAVCRGGGGAGRRWTPLDLSGVPEQVNPGRTFQEEVHESHRTESRDCAWTLRLENAESLDGPVRAIEPSIKTVFGSGRRGWVLRGEWLGHAVHPLLTDVALGTWTSASILDLLVLQG